METAYWAMKGEIRELTEKLKQLTIAQDADSAKGEDKISIQDIKVSTWTRWSRLSAQQMRAKINAYIVDAVETKRKELVAELTAILETMSQIPLKSTKAKLIMLLDPDSLNEAEILDVNNALKYKEYSNKGAASSSSRRQPNRRRQRRRPSQRSKSRTGKKASQDF